MKLLINIIFKIGLIIIFIFVMDLTEVYKKLFGFGLIKTPYACIFVGIGFLLLVPEYFFSLKEYEKQFNKYNPRLASYWVFSLLVS
jgi:predicted tellurium resistance membrane protein TerC